MEAHRTFREEVAGDGTPEELPRPRAILHAAKRVEAESAPKFHLGAEESQTAGNAEDPRWVSEGGENTSLGSLAPCQVPGYGAAAPTGPTDPSGERERVPPKGTARWTGLTLPAEPTGPQLCFVFQSSTREVHETIYHASLWKLRVQFRSAASISVTPA